MFTLKVLVWLSLVGPRDEWGDVLVILNFSVAPLFNRYRTCWLCASYYAEVGYPLIGIIMARYNIWIKMPFIKIREDIMCLVWKIWEIEGYCVFDLECRGDPTNIWTLALDIGSTNQLKMVNKGTRAPYFDKTYLGNLQATLSVTY